MRKRCEMLKARRTLVLLLGFLGYAGYYVIERVVSWQKTLLTLDGILMLAALVLLGVTFSGVELAADGNLKIKKSSRYWRVMHALWKSSGWREVVSLCRAYWFTVITLALAPTIIVLLAVCFCLVVGALWNFAGAVRTEPLFALKLFGGVIGGAAILWVTVPRVLEFLERFSWVKVLRPLCLVAYLGFFAWLLGYYLPIEEIRGQVGGSQSDAVAIYWGWVARIALMIVGSVLVLYLAFRYWSPLKNSVIGRILRQGFKMLKDGTCPLLVAVDDK